MADLAAVSDVEAVLLRSISDPDEVASCEWALKGASNAIRDYVEQFIELVAADPLTVNGPLNSSEILLPEIPVVSVASVYEDEVLLTAEDDYILDANLGILHRVYQGAARSWSHGIQNIDIVYTHGFATIPDTIVTICARAASRAFQAALKSEESGGIPGVSSKALGDFSVSYATDTSEGQLGASSAWMLLMSEKDLLDKYRAK